MNGSKNRRHLIPSNPSIQCRQSQPHTHTHHKATCCTLTPTYPLQTVPHAAHTVRYCLKTDGVTFIELKCEEFLKTKHMKTKLVTDKLCNMNIIIHQPQDSFGWYSEYSLGPRHKFSCKSLHCNLR